MTCDLNGHIQLWDTTDPANPRLLTTLAGSPNALNTVAITTDGRTLATPAPDNTVQLWNVTDPTHPGLRALLTNAVRPIAFLADGHTLAVIGTDTSVQLRETDLSHAAARICELAPTPTRQTTWQQYFPGQPDPQPCS